MKQESHSSSSSSSPSSPTEGEIQVREREDVPISDISAVRVSNLVDDGSGQPEEIQANKKKQIKRKPTIERGDPCDSEIPEWLQEFRENLVDDEVPERGNSHASSSHEPSLEPTLARSAEMEVKTVLKNSLPNRPKLRDLPETPNSKGQAQKMHWRSCTSCRNFWFVLFLIIPK